MVSSFSNLHANLSEMELKRLLNEAKSEFPPAKSNILVIVPDLTRTAPIDKFFPILCERFLKDGSKVDFIVALGTHRQPSEDEVSKLVGLDKKERQERFPGVRIFNHQWDLSAELTLLGKISADKLKKISKGLLAEDVPITINKRVLDYDHLIIIGPVFPHEVVGFSGSNKYFFPGLAGREIIDVSHWLGALVTNLDILGKQDTPVRQLIDEAALLIRKPITYINLVMAGKELKGCFVGRTKEAWRKATELSAQLNVVWHDHPYESILSIPSTKYEDLWTGAKAIYKLESVVLDGGDLIVYAPHLKILSFAHDELIREIGYHVRDYFLFQEQRFAHVPRGVLAHSTHVRGAGSWIDGQEKARINVTLATGIDEETCLQMGLSYRDPATIDVEEWRKHYSGRLLVEDAGEQAHLCKA